MGDNKDSWDSIACKSKTKQRYKKTCTNYEFKNYDEFLNYLLDLFDQEHDNFDEVSK